MPDENAVAVVDDVCSWADELDRVAARIGSRFARSETRTRVRDYLIGLLAPVQRKNSWQLAEQMGDSDPYGVQYLLGRADWNPDMVRDDLRQYVVTTLGDAQAVLVLDETGFLKKGTRSAGVARQYTGTAGRIENAQVGVFLAYSSTHGTAFIDRELYLPREWTDDPQRCKAAGLPKTVTFATKGQLAKTMLARAFGAGVPAEWVTGDEVYGNDSQLRVYLESLTKSYCLAVKRNAYVWCGTTQSTVEALTEKLPARAWHVISVGQGSKGPRRYKWAWVRINHNLGKTRQRWLVVRKSMVNGELAYYLACGSANTTLTKLALVAGSRWQIEAGFESAKQEVGLADYEVRSFTGWYRHVTLSLLAHAVLAGVRKMAWEPDKKSGQRGQSE